MIDRAHELPVVRQASLLQVSRSSVYSLPRPVPPARLAIMHRIDALHLEHPFAGSRMLRDLLRAEGVVIGRVAVATLMRRMGIEALYRRPCTSKPAPGPKIYPDLLRGLVIDRPNQVWAMDITCSVQCPEPHGARLRLSGRGAGLVQPTGAGLAAVDHAGGRVLPRRGAGGPGAPWQAGDLQHGPRQPLHQRGLHRDAAGPGDPHQHEWPRRLAGQRLRRAAVALGEIRGGLPAGL